MPSSDLNYFRVLLIWQDHSFYRYSGDSWLAFCTAPVPLSDAVVLIPILRSLVITVTASNLYLALNMG